MAVAGGRGFSYPFEDFGDGILALGALPEHVFCPHGGFQVDAGHAGTFLASVVLLLHEQVEFVESVLADAVFFLVVFQGLKQAYHRHAALVFQLFYHLFCM